VDAKSTPNHADVLRGTQRLGTTPTRLALPCGTEVSLTFQLERYTSTHKVVVPTSGGAPASTRLTRATYTVLVDSSPIGASILVANKTVGITPAMVKLPAGKTSTVIIAMDGYASASMEVTEAVTKSVHTTLEKLPPKAP
jgi:hypothetical protein